MNEAEHVLWAATFGATFATMILDPSGREMSLAQRASWARHEADLAVLGARSEARSETDPDSFICQIVDDR